MWTYDLKEVTKEELSLYSKEVLLEAIKIKTFEISPNRWSEIQEHWTNMTHNELVNNINIHNLQCVNSWLNFKVNARLLNSLGKPKIKTCTCGAKHTSFPKHHSSWCDIY